ncbi:MAG: type II toxin-antitoxin system RelB/DinJ family antitoxin [Lachnospiraceae bacterium]
MAQTNISIRMDEDLKKQFDTFCSDIGMNMTTAFSIFAKTVVREQRIPFELKVDIPNAMTVTAMQEAEKLSRDPHAKRYSSFSEILTEVNSDV